MKLTKYENKLLQKYSYIFEQGGDINDFVKAASEDKDAEAYNLIHIIEWFDLDPNLNPLNEINSDTVDYLNDIIRTSKKVINNPVTTRIFTIAGKNLEEVHFPNVTTIYEDDSYLIDDAPKIRVVDLPNLQRISEEDFCLFLYEAIIHNLKEVITTKAGARELAEIQDNKWFEDKITIV